MCGVTGSYVRHDSFLCDVPRGRGGGGGCVGAVVRLMPTRDIGATCRIHMDDNESDMAFAYARYYASIRSRDEATPERDEATLERDKVTPERDG
mmetsp:Transcript_31220/g.45656  ORF Transcript_31220/g.45656 Transcript_31220/m.45656 type:complete len:94 (-) Transcript_31220:63-344(-)